VAFSTCNKKIISGSNDKTIKIWNSVSTLYDDAEVSYLVLSPDNLKIVSCACNTNIKIWDIKTSKLLRILTGHENRVYCVAISYSGHRIISGGYDRSIKIWHGVTGRLIRTLRGHTHSIQTVTVSPR
jgi:WD40 repeat protein